eukprot:1161568-Pelagomonas_calceolata.AAC.12
MVAVALDRLSSLNSSSKSATKVKRGLEQSRKAEDIKREMTVLGEAGYKEECMSHTSQVCQRRKGARFGWIFEEHVLQNSKHGCMRVYSHAHIHTCARTRTHKHTYTPLPPPCAQVTLLGQNIDAYGRDLPGMADDGSGRRAWTFTDLLRYVHDVPGIERIRFATSHPRYFTGALERLAAP